MLLQNGTDLEQLLRSKLKGEHSSLILSFNDGHAPNYMTAKAYYEELFDSKFDCDWISEEEKQKAFDSNSVWELQWYPDTPVGFNRIIGSSLQTVVEAFKNAE